MIPVFQPLLTKKDKLSVLRSLNRGEISGNFGESINLFEKDFSKYIGCKFASTTSSGTTALQLAVRALNLKKKSEIIISSCTNIATALAVVHNGHIPIPIDSDLSNWNIDLNKIENQISKKTKAIIVVHFLGNPVNMNKIKYLKNKYNLKIIEDAAEAHGAKFNGKMIGNHSDISCFSFYANKVLTSGEGGMVCTNNYKLYKKINLYKNLGFSKPRFVHKVLAYNFRMSGIQAALGLSQLKNINKIIKQKIKIAQIYKNELKEIKNIEFAKEEKNSRNIYWQVGIRIKGNLKTKLVRYLKKNGIDNRSFFYSMRNQPCLKKIIPKKVPKTLNSNILWREGIYLPSSHNLKKKEIRYICSLIKKFIK
jgi:perosamine synthetase